MNLKYLIILILPIILHIKASPAIIVFLVMNSIISVLIEYTKIEVRILGHLVENKDRIEEIRYNNGNELIIYNVKCDIVICKVR